MFGSLVDRAQMMNRCLISGIAVALLFGIGCSSSTAPDRPPTLLVTNPLCEGTDCRSIQIRAFIWAYAIPQGPFGAELVGEVSGPTACLEFPEIWEIVVRHVDSQGNVLSADTLTSDLDDQIFLTALDPESRDEVFLGMTESFVPGSEKGWSLNLVRDPAGAYPPFRGELTSGPRCSPD